MNNQQLEKIYQNTILGIIVCDRDGNIMDNNESAERIFARDLDGANIYLCLSREIQESYPKLIANFVDSSDEVKSMLERKPVLVMRGDDRVYLRVSLIKSQTERGLGAIVILEEVTDLIKSQRELEANNKKLKVLLNNLTDANYDYRFTEDKIYISEKLKSLLGFEIDEIGTEYQSLAVWQERIHPDEKETAITRLNSYLQNPDNNNKVHESRYRIRTKEGKYIEIESRGMGFWDEDGNLISFTGIINDITDIVTQIKKMKTFQNQQRQYLVKQGKAFTRYRWAAIACVGALAWFMITMKIDLELSGEKRKFIVQSREAEAVSQLIQLLPTGLMASIAAYLFNGGQIKQQDASKTIDREEV